MLTEKEANTIVEKLSGVLSGKVLKDIIPNLEAPKKLEPM